MLSENGCSSTNPVVVEGNEQAQYELGKPRRRTAATRYQIYHNNATKERVASASGAYATPPLSCWLVLATAVAIILIVSLHFTDHRITLGWSRLGTITMFNCTFVSVCFVTSVLECEIDTHFFSYIPHILRWGWRCRTAIYVSAVYHPLDSSGALRHLS